MRAALAMVAEAIDECAAVASWALSDEDLVDGLEELYVAQQRLAAANLALVRELDGRGLAVAQGASSTVVWLRGRLRMSVGAARRLVELAAAVDASPAVLREALGAGAVSVEQAQVIVQAVAALPAEVGPAVVEKAAATLVGCAGEHEPVVLRRLGERVLQVVAPEVAEQVEAVALERAERRAQRGRFFTLSDGGDGAVRLSGRWVPRPRRWCGRRWSRCAGPSPVMSAVRGSVARMRWWTSAGWPCPPVSCLTRAVSGLRSWSLSASMCWPASWGRGCWTPERR